MGLNWITISIVSVCVIALFIFLIKRNVKDEKNLSNLLDKNEHVILDKDEAEINGAE